MKLQTSLYAARASRRVVARAVAVDAGALVRAVPHRRAAPRVPAVCARAAPFVKGGSCEFCAWGDAKGLLKPAGAWCRVPAAVRDPSSRDAGARHGLRARGVPHPSSSLVMARAGFSPAAPVICRARCQSSLPELVAAGAAAAPPLSPEHFSSAFARRHFTCSRTPSRCITESLNDCVTASRKQLP